MPISVVCQCGAKLNAKDELAGRSVKCPKCSQPLKIPAASAAQSAAAKPSTEKPPAAKTTTSKPATAKPTSSGQPAAKKTAQPKRADPHDAIGGLLDEIGVIQPVKHDITCPKCGAGMKEGAVICVACGFNTKTGKQISSSSDSAALERREDYFDKKAAKVEAQQAKNLAAGDAKGGAKAKNSASELTSAEFAICGIFPVIGLIVGIVWCLTRNPKGPKMLGISALVIGAGLLVALYMIMTNPQ